jgi:hypothetical protein
MRKIIFMLATLMTVSMTAAAIETVTPAPEKAPAAENAKSDLEIELAPGAPKAELARYYSYNFGQVMVGMVSYGGFTLRNTGYESMLINDVDVTGPDFTASTNCPRVLPPRSYCSFQVRFAPWLEGYKRGSLYISTSGGDIIVDLFGWAYR